MAVIVKQGYSFFLFFHQEVLSNQQLPSLTNFRVTFDIRYPSRNEIFSDCV